MKQRKKGHEFERYIARLFKGLGYEARRILEYQESEGVDVIVEDRFSIQCKRWKGYAPVNKIKEIRDESGRIPLLITKADREPAIVCLYLEDFIKLIGGSHV